MNFLTEFKARKAKFGFKTKISGQDFMEKSSAFHACLSQVDKRNYTIEIKTLGIYNSCDLMIYTDDEMLGQLIRSEIEAANSKLSSS